MASRRDHGREPPTPLRRRALIITMILTGSAFLGLMYYGAFASATINVTRPVVSVLDLSPIPVPQIFAVHQNSVITSNQTMEFTLEILYDPNTQSPAYINAGNWVRITLPPPEKGIIRWDVPYVYFGFFTNDSGKLYPPNTWVNGTLNYAVHDPASNTIIQGYDNPSEYFGIGGSVNSPLMTIYRYAQSDVEGDYVIRATNSGSTVLNGTFIFGYSLESFERPLLTTGMLAFAASATLGLVTMALYVYYSNRRSPP